MKVTVDKLAANLRAAIRPSYVVSGDEPLIVQECCDLIRSTLKEHGYSERKLFHADGSFNWDEVTFSANSMSLFADKKLIEVRLAGGKPGDAGARALKSFAESPGDDTVLLLVTGRLDGSSQKTKWFKALDSVGCFVPVWPIEVAQLPGWINRRLKSAGLMASREAVDLLVQKVEGNLLAAAQEIERLKLCSTGQRIEVDHVMDDVADNSRFDVFSLIDVALAGNNTRTLRMIQGLRSEGAEILQIVGLLGRELRSLNAMSFSMHRGHSVEAVIREHKVWQKRKSMVGAALARHDRTVWSEMIRSLAVVDQLVKGIGIGDPWNELTSLLLRLSGSRIIGLGAKTLGIGSRTIK